LKKLLPVETEKPRTVLVVVRDFDVRRKQKGLPQQKAIPKMCHLKK
jgi:hypothetical protein